MPEVRSVCIAVPHTLRRRGVEVPTGLWKEPVEGPVAIRELGLEGDVNADRRFHGGYDKAVYAYARESVDWWETELGTDLPDGFFGENLTVTGVDVDGARPGDVWRLGTVVLEVTEPRLPCWKLATKVGEPGFVRRFARANRPGAYLRVLAEGEVQAGDAIELEPTSVERPTMRELAPGALV